MDVAIIYQQQVTTCPENQLKKHEMTERQENQTSVFVLFYPGPGDPSQKNYNVLLVSWNATQDGSD